MDRTWAVVIALTMLTVLKMAALGALGFIIWRADDSALPPEGGGGEPPRESRYRPQGPGGAWSKAPQPAERQLSEQVPV